MRKEESKTKSKGSYKLGKKWTDSVYSLEGGLALIWFTLQLAKIFDRTFADMQIPLSQFSVFLEI